MEYIEYPSKHNELIILNPAHIVALRSSINDDATHATIEIHTTSSNFTIIEEFDDVDAMKEKFEQIERLINWDKRKPKLKQVHTYVPPVRQTEQNLPLVDVSPKE